MQALMAMAATNSTKKVTLQATMALERMLAKEHQHPQHSLEISQQSICRKTEMRTNGGAYDLSSIFEATSVMDHPRQLDFPTIEWSFDEVAHHHHHHRHQFLDSKIDTFSVSTNKRRKHHHPDILLHPDCSDQQKRIRHSNSSSLVRSMNFARDLDHLAQGQIMTLVEVPSQHSILGGASSISRLPNNGRTNSSKLSRPAGTRTSSALLPPGRISTS